MSLISQLALTTLDVLHIQLLQNLGCGHLASSLELPGTQNARICWATVNRLHIVVQSNNIVGLRLSVQQSGNAKLQPRRNLLANGMWTGI